MNKSLPVFFGSDSCPACRHQKEILKGVTYNYYDIDKFEAPKEITDSQGSYSMPTWFIPTSENKGVLLYGVQSKRKITQNKNKFGELGSLAKYGKNFPNGLGFNNTDTFETHMQKLWGDDVTRSGTYGRELGPNSSFSDTLANSYFKAPGGNHPSGDYATALTLNRNCNILNNNNNYSDVGLVADSDYNEISGTVRFGGNRRRIR
jgi:glutaredoxin